MKDIAQHLFEKALDANHPVHLVKETVARQGNHITIEDREWEVDNGEIYVIAVGKASLPMAGALEQILELSADHLLCITPEMQPEPSYAVTSMHPIPDEKSVNAAEQLIQFIEKIPRHSRVLFALSGGASALLCKPAAGINLEDINQTNQILLKSGADIEAMNAVRKHLSAIKGGQLLNYFSPDITLIDLVLSDVPGDKLEIIGSGPTIPDSSTFEDAYNALTACDLWNDCLPSVQAHIRKGMAGSVPETIKPGQDPLSEHHSHIIGSARKFAERLAELATDEGFTSIVAKQAYNAPVSEVANEIARRIEEMMNSGSHPMVLVFYGESTVKVTGSGKGGRNQELALHGALKIKHMEGVTWLSAGTDGIDGPTDAAGAIVGTDTIKKAEKKGLDPNSYLENNDSYHFHEQMDTLLKTGPTGNNVMDVVIILIE